MNHHQMENKEGKWQEINILPYRKWIQIFKKINQEEKKCTELQFSENRLRQEIGKFCKNKSQM